MAVEDVARAAVDEELDRLRDRFGAFTVHETTAENDPGYYAHGLDLVREHGMLADAGATVRDDDGRLLAIRHPEAPDEWGTPGGLREGNEPLEETAVREVREETGIAAEVTGIRWVQVTTIVHRDDDRSYPMLTVEFDATGTGEPSADVDDEILEARWLADPPDGFGDVPG